MNNVWEDRLVCKTGKIILPEDVLQIDMREDSVWFEIFKSGWVNRKDVRIDKRFFSMYKNGEELRIFQNDIAKWLTHDQDVVIQYEDGEWFFMDNKGNKHNLYEKYNQLERVRIEPYQDVDAIKNITVFTMGYFPFVMGGSVWQPIKCNVDATGPYNIGKGYKAYLVTAPDGRTFVAEAETGAFVGPTLKQVMDDIEEGDPKIMAEQVEKARNQVKIAQQYEPEKFWDIIGKSK